MKLNPPQQVKPLLATPQYMKTTMQTIQTQQLCTCIGKMIDKTQLLKPMSTTAYIG